MRPLFAACAVFLAVAAAAQPGPPGGFGGPPPDLSQLAAEVRRRPTDAKSVHPRFRALMESLRAEGRPPPAKTMKALEDIRRLLGEGSLTKAAHLLDQVAAASAAPPDAPAAAPVAAPAAAAALPAAAIAASAYGVPELSNQAPALLSAAEPGRPALPVAMRATLLAEPRLAEPPASPYAAKSAPAAALLPEPAPARGSPPWRLIAALAGTAAFVGAGLLLAAAGRGPSAPKTAAPAAAAPAAAPPKTLTDKYSLGRAIASGGMGEVYEGRDLTLGRRVAIKRMLPDIKLDAAMRGQFLKEARTVAKLSHPYIIPIHDCLESDGDLYLVFEFVDGETLDRRLSRDARLSLKECRRIFGYVCAAVAHAHDHHVLHRDLKPANIMLDTGGIARVMDFGIALESTRLTTTTAPGILDASGTLRYMPPEQHYGKSVRASDVYAMGVCLYEMATGHPPFAAGTVDELIEAKRNRRYPAPSALYSELPKEFDLFIAAVLAPDPQKRVSSAPEFLELLGEIPA